MIDVLGIEPYSRNFVVLFFYPSVKVLCGNETQSPSCYLCPKNEDMELNTWCRGNCFYDEAEEACKEGISISIISSTCLTILNQRLVLKQSFFHLDPYTIVQGECITTGKTFYSIAEAKAFCSRDGKCAGVTTKAKYITREFVLCLSISMQDENKHHSLQIRNVYKKEGVSGLYCQRLRY